MATENGSRTAYENSDLALVLHLDRWQQAWYALTPTPAPAALHQTLLSCYREPHRAYHTLQHLAECMQFLDDVREHCEHPAEVALVLANCLTL